MIARFHPALCVEGTNNKIKTLKRQAYGYRDIEFLSYESWPFMKPSTHLPDEP